MDCFDQDGSVYYDVGACYQGCDPDDGTGCPAGTACDVGGICKRLSNAGPGERCTGSLETFACSEGYYCGHDGLCHGSCDYWGSGLSCPTNEQCTPYSQADENGGICVESPRYGTDPAEIGELCTTLYAGCGDDGVELRGECRFGCHAADCSACGESCMTCLKDCRTDAECTVDYPRCTSDGCVESIEPAP
jgi:hypothetical protein